MQLEMAGGHRWVPLVFLAMAIAVAGVSAAVADGKKNRRVGTYEGTIETGGTVSFRFAKSGKILDFTARDVPRRCYVGGVEQDFGTASFDTPKMDVRGAAKFSYSNFSTLPGQSGKPIEIRVSGKSDSAAGGTALKGKVFQFDTTVAGTDGSCTTGEPEWTAKKKK